MINARVSRHDIGRRTVLSVAGEIDMAVAPELDVAVEQALTAGASDLWIDLSATRFMDSSGVRVLVEAQHRAYRFNRQLAVICPHGRVRRVLELTGVLTHIAVYEDRDAAHRAS